MFWPEVLHDQCKCLPKECLGLLVVSLGRKHEGEAAKAGGGNFCGRKLLR